MSCWVGTAHQPVGWVEQSETQLPSLQNEKIKRAISGQDLLSQSLFVPLIDRDLLRIATIN